MLRSLTWKSFMQKLQKVVKTSTHILLFHPSKIGGGSEDSIHLEQGIHHYVQEGRKKRIGRCKIKIGDFQQPLSNEVLLLQELNLEERISRKATKKMSPADH